MKSSRESGLDYVTRGAEGQNATDTQRDEEEEDNEEEGGGVGGDGHAEGTKGEAAGEKEQAEGHCPESSAAKTSQRWRPKLSRMERVLSSSSAEDEESQRTDRWVLLRYIEVRRQTDKQTDRQTVRWVLQRDWQVDRKTGGWGNMTLRQK